MDGVGPAARGEGLDGHGGVIGEAAQALGAVGVEAFECFVEGACGVHAPETRRGTDGE
ncbi:hypothetical protein GCM10010446_39180 [Streptomyces enissocaesilis]|uniref:Uncharacterized protein n=1 Tax=Streptomyces enissocaesilis TaxID=332589 RepID=A0ABN3XEE7_9ACTN